MKEKRDALSSSPTKDEDAFHHVTAHRRTNSFSSIAKAAYKATKIDKSNRTTTSYKLNPNANKEEDSQHLIAILEDKVSEGEKVRREMGQEIARLKDQLQKAEAQVTMLKQTLLKYQRGRLAPRTIDVDLCINDNQSMDSPCSDSCWTEPLNTSYADSMQDFPPTPDPDSDFDLNTIINTINMNTYNNINNIQVNNINEINYIIDINNISNITNYNTTNNFHTVNNITTTTNTTVNNFSPEALSPPGTPTSDSSISLSPSTSFEKEKRVRMFNRTTTHHKRRGSDTENAVKLDEKYQRRHSEGKVLRIAGLREQVRQALAQIMNASYSELEDEWPLIQALLQGELSDSVLPPPPRHLVHAGFVREGERVPEGYWIDDTLLLLFRDFLIVACQPKLDTLKPKHQFKEIVHLTAGTRVDSWATDTDHFGLKITTEQCSRSFLISSKDDSEKWAMLIGKYIAALRSCSVKGTSRYYLIAPCDGFTVEPTTIQPVGETKLCLEEPRKGIYHYQSFFYSKPHINYVGGSIACPVAISIEDKATRFALSPSLILRRNSDAVQADPETVTHRALVRTQAGDECVCIAIPANLARSTQSAHTEILAQLSQVLPSIALPQLKLNTTLFRVKSPELDTELLQYEANNMRRCHKIGVVYCAKGARTEAEMLQTTHENASADFHQFLDLLGQKVTLKAWADYTGGLDTKNDTDGVHSLFTNFWGIPVMFHVSTMLPNDRNNPTVAKKRHIGNDIVVVVFKDHDDETLFVPSTFKSHLNHIFCVVQHVNCPNGTVSYKVSFCSKDGIGTFLPALPSPPVFVKDAKFKHFLLAKIVNAERAAMRSAPFAKRHTLARFTFLKNLWKQYSVQPKEMDDSQAHINTL